MIDKIAEQKLEVIKKMIRLANDMEKEGFIEESNELDEVVKMIKEQLNNAN